MFWAGYRLILAIAVVNTVTGCALVQNASQAALKGYQKGISPYYYSKCPYKPSCSGYSRQAIKAYGLLKGTLMTGDRLLRCNHWAHGGHDLPAHNLFGDLTHLIFAPVLSPEWIENYVRTTIKQLEQNTTAASKQLQFARHLAESGDHDRALTELKRFNFLFSGSPLAPDALFMLGVLTLKDTKMERAEKLFAEIAQDFPESPLATPSRLMAAQCRMHLAAFADARQLLAPLVNGAGESIGMARYLFLCSYLLEKDTGSALAWLADHRSKGRGESKRYDQLVQSIAAQAGCTRKSLPAAAVFSAILPGSGQAYSHHYGDGFMALFWTSFCGYAAYEAHDEDVDTVAVFMGAIGLGFYLANIYNGSNSAMNYNRATDHHHLKKSLHHVLMYYDNYENGGSSE